MPTFVVIGSNCFTGCHIVDALLDEPGNRVIGISRSPEYMPLFLPYKNRDLSRFEFQQIDIVRNFAGLVKLLDERRPEYVINVAALSEVALSNQRPVEYFAVNTLGAVKLCNELRVRPFLKQYVHISSAEIFGSCTRPATEETLFNPSTPYAVSKAAADMYLLTLKQNFGFPVTIIRSTNVYGRHQQLFKIIPRTAIYLKMGRTIELHGGGLAVKSFIHIRDVVAGLMLALRKGTPGVYHFSVPTEQTIADIVQLVCGQMGYDFSLHTKTVGERLGQDARYTLDCGKAYGQLGWVPAISLEEGISEVVDWVEQNWNEMRQQPLEYQHKT
jgi:dTDP-glucose 4,6-dehydratase